MNKLWTILILLLILIGLSYMWPFSKQSKIVEIRDFSCPGMTGFTFKYPVFEGWGVKEVTKPFDDQSFCYIVLEPGAHPLPDSSGRYPYPQISVNKQPKSGWKHPIYDNPKNPRGIQYSRSVNESQESVRFFTPDLADPVVEISLEGTPVSFDKDFFFQTVIESFRLDKSSTIESKKDYNSGHLTADEVLRRYKDEELPAFVGIPLEDVNQIGNFGDRPLHIATVRGNIDEIIALIRGGADINAPGDLGSSPLHAAVGQGHVEAVKLLLTNGASTSAKNEFGQTPLDIAKLKRREDIVRLLQYRTTQST